MIEASNLEPLIGESEPLMHYVEANWAVVNMFYLAISFKLFYNNFFSFYFSSYSLATSYP